MNPNVDSSPSMHLPEPLPAGQNPNLNPSAEQTPAMETGPTSNAVLNSETAAAPPPLIASTPMPPVDPQAATTGVPIDQPTGPVAAADSDQIEKEWVNKAKQIVNATKQDPYQQNRQLAAFKADYLQKRYNKIVKLSE